MNQLLGFDPLVFLGIKNLKDEEKSAVSKKLLDKISQYLLIRVSELLPEDDMKDIEDPDKLFSLAQTKITDLNNKVKVFLEDFKKEGSR